MNRITIPGRILIGLILAAIVFFLYMRIKPKTSETPIGADTTTSDAFASGTYNLKLIGSNTIGADLIPVLVNNWLQSKNATNIDRKNLSKDEIEITSQLNGQPFSVYIQASGSLKGFKALENNATDIGMASEQSSSDALLTPDNEHVIGLDGIAIIVNQNNKVTNMSLDMAKKIFSGTINDWADVPGSGITGKINRYSRDENSGTNGMFKKLVLQDAAKADAKTFEDSKMLVDGVGNDQSGIGFVSYTFITANVKALALHAGPKVKPLLPTVMTIQSEEYPLCRRLYLYTKGNKNTNVADFIHYVEYNGQTIVSNAGFIGLDINTQSASDKKEEIKNESSSYQNLVEKSDKLSTEFRFMTGSYALDTRALSDKIRLEKLLSLPKNRHKKIILIGFTDNTGNPGKNIKLSQERAEALKTALETEGVKNITTAGFGDAKPLNENATESQRRLNRRVEVWLTEE